MAKAMMKLLRKHNRLILILAIAMFILLVILGFAMNPDKTWQPPVDDRTTQTP